MTRLGGDAAQSERKALSEQAAFWSRLLDAEGEASRRGDFESWRAEDARRATAFERVERIRKLLSDNADTSPSLLALRQEARDYATGRRASVKRRGRFRRAAFGALAAGIVALAVIDVFEPSGGARAARELIAYFKGNVYATPIGAREVVALDDGSIVTLDADSRISVHFDNGVRGVTLERGQALFAVAHDKAHPFVVSAGNRRVTALGTEFEVQLTSSDLEVTLVEGRVTVASTETAADSSDASGAGRPGLAPAHPAPALVELHPGEQYVQPVAAAAVVRTADTRRVTSWSSGQLIFDNDRLADAVSRFNRYARRPIVIGDARLQDVRISGVFATGAAPAFVASLADYYSIKVIKDDANGVVIGLGD